MKRTSVNPVEWGLQFSLDQGEVVEGATRHLRCSGQVSVVPDAGEEMGLKVVSPNEIRGQMECALANIDAVLEKAGMTRANVVGLRVYTTQMDAYIENYDVYANWIAQAGTRPPQTLLGVQRLFHPDVVVEIEIEAAA